jgi:tripartite ATP-independent transporter DctM subunit
MEPYFVGILAFVFVFILIILGVHIGIALFIVGSVGLIALSGISPALGLLQIRPFELLRSYTFAVVPLFILMGHFAFMTGITKDLFSAAHRWVGHFPGGLAIATCLACAGFAASSGSSIASAATMGKIALPEMKRYDYKTELAIGTIAAGGTLAMMIPPSIGIVIYGIFTGTSIGKMLIAGIVPGIVEAISYIIVIMLISLHTPEVAPPGPRFSWKSRLSSVKRIWLTFLVVVMVIGGIYTGVFTPTEAGGIGAFLLFVIGILFGKINLGSFIDSMNQTARTSGMIFLTILGALVFAMFMALTRLPTIISEGLLALPFSPMVILIGILLMYIILGMFIDAIGMWAITLPVIFPYTEVAGFDTIWFGILIMRTAEIGLISPPFGLNLFVIKGVIPEVPIEVVIRGILPFLLADLIVLGVFVAFPGIVTYVPNLMAGL